MSERSGFPLRRLLPRLALVLWVAGCAPPKGEFWAYGCSSLGEDSRARLSVSPEFEVPHVQFQGAFELAEGSTIPGSQRQLLASVTFWVPMRFPAADLELTGRFVDDSARSERRPRRLIAEVAHLDRRGREQTSEAITLKVNGAGRFDAEQPSAFLDLAARETLALYVTPRGGQLDSSDRVDFFMRRRESADRAAAGPRPSWMASLQPIVAALARRRAVKFATVEFGLDTFVPARDLVVSGTYEQEVLDGDSLRSVLALVTHRDAEGKKVQKRRIRGNFADGRLVTVTKRLPEFDVKAGDTIELKIKPKKGALEIGDLFELALLLFDPA